MNFDDDPKDPEPKSSCWKGTRVAVLIGGLTLTLLFWMTCPQKAAAQDLLNDLAMMGIRVATGTLAPRCSVERLPLPARTRPYPPPAQNVNVQVYPPPPPPRSMNVRVWPEPVRKPVGTWTSGGYVLGGSIPAQQPVTPVPPPYDDYSPTQEALRGH